jgi:protein phosphatase
MRLRQVAGLSDPGRVRRRNEDAYVCAPPLFAVADGMGGAQAGEVASRLTTAALRDYHDADDLEPEARLRSIIQEANRRIYARAASDPKASGMGTTVTAALFAGERVAIGHVGDSRAYRVRDGSLEQLTQDHSLVADLVRSGRLTPQEAELHPQRSVITRALGTDAAVLVDSFSVDGRPGDVFLLCSDGLTTMVDEATVLHAIAEAPDVGAAARSLVAAANRSGGEDNITVVLFAFEEGDPSIEDTFSDLEVPAALLEAPAPEPLPRPSAPFVVPGPPAEPHRVSRALLLVALALLLFAGVAGLALWGLSRAHFVGADPKGRVVVYQGVPWDLVGGVDLYREIYVSGLLAAQLSAEERQELFDHSLVSEAEARTRVAVYEREAEP